MSSPLLRLMICAAMLTTLAVAGNAQAKSHLWDMLRVFSNEQGNIQFIDMFVSDPAGTAEHQFLGKLLTSNANTYVFPNNLDTGINTFQRWVLIATQDYADLPGAPTPDYIIPANFFDPAGDELRYRTVVDIFTIPPGAMPTNGIHMLERDLSTPINEGINFAGDTATVSLSTSIPTLPIWGAGFAALVGVMALFAWRARKDSNPQPSG